MTGTPNPAWAVDLALSQTNTWVGFQALGSWSRPFNPDHVDNTTNGTPADGIRFGFETYGSTYFELYVADIDHAAYRAELEMWHARIFPPDRLLLAREGAAMRLDWESFAGGLYQVEASADLRGWSSLGSPLAATTNAPTQPIPAGEPAQFFRLRVLP